MSNRFSTAMNDIMAYLSKTKAQVDTAARQGHKQIAKKTIPICLFFDIRQVPRLTADPIFYYTHLKMP